MREAEGAFGDPTVFIEQAVVDPRHIEVQILADGAGQRDPPLRARLLGAAPAPEGRRDRARAATSTPSSATRICADAVRFAREIGYRNAGTVEFLLDPERQLRLHRDEPAHPGRAHRHRGDHRRRPGRSRSCGSPPARPSPTSACSQDAHPAPRRRAAVPDHHRGPGQRLPARHRQITTYRSPGGARHPPRRRHDVHRRRDQSAHFDSMLAKLTCRGRTFEKAVGQGPAGARRVPDPRRHHQHPVPAGGARRPGLPGRRRHHVVHRDPPAAADRPRVAATAAPSC